VEERLIAAAVGRAGKRTRMVASGAVREPLAAHPSLGADQAGMVRDLCLGSAGVQVVVGRGPARPTGPTARRSGA
jgi:hypothetical protein